MAENEVPPVKRFGHEFYYPSQMAERVETLFLELADLGFVELYCLRSEPPVGVGSFGDASELGQRFFEVYADCAKKVLYFRFPWERR